MYSLLTIYVEVKYRLGTRMLLRAVEIQSRKYFSEENGSGISLLIEILLTNDILVQKLLRGKHYMSVRRWN